MKPYGDESIRGGAYYRPEIDGLRAVAVLVVFGYHYFPRNFPGGFLGVDIFFVISGFLICGIICNDLHLGTFSLCKFYSRRIRRIFPALFFVLATTLIVGWFAFLPDEYRALGKHVFGGSGFISNFFLWREAGYFDIAAKAKPLLHLWSLGIEEQFYIFFPMLLWGCTKKHFRILTVIIALCLASFIENIHRMPNPTVNFYSPLARAWELLAGAILSLAMRHPVSNELTRKLERLASRIIYDQEGENNNHCLGLGLTLIGIILLIAALLIIRDNNPYPGWKALLPVLSAIFLISAPPNPISQRLLANHLVVFIGRISYPLYLWHWALFSFAFIFNGGLDAGSWSTWPLRMGLAAASFVLAVLTYLLVEKPIRFGIGKNKKYIVFLLILLITSIGICGLYIWFTNGMPDRMSIKKYQDFSEQLEPFQTHDNTAYTYAPKSPRDEHTQIKYTNIGSPSTVAIFGDSHALSAYYGIAELNNSIGNNTFLISRSSSRFPIISLLFDDGNINKDITLQIMDVINAQEDIKYVFIVTRGPWIYDVYARSNDDFINLLAQKTPREIFEKSLQSAINKFKEHNKKIFIIIDNPRLPEDIRFYLPRPFRNGKKLKLTKDDVLTMQYDYRIALNNIQGAEIIESINLFCPNGQVLLFDETGLPLYKDQDHLSKAGSIFQAKHLLIPYLRQATETNK